MKKRKYLIIFGFLILASLGILAHYYSIPTEAKIDREIKQNISNSSELIRLEKVRNNYILALYKDGNTIGGAVYSKKFYSWDLEVYTNKLPIDNVEEVSLRFSSNTNLPKTLYIGLIKNPEIDSLTLNNQIANITILNNLKIWYVINSENLYREILIKGVSNQGKVITEIQTETSTSNLNEIYNDLFVYNQWYLEEPFLKDNSLQKLEGDSEVVVAILDSGLDLTHPDLDKKKVLAPKNVITNSSDIVDNLSHGTKVTGIISAISNNKEGIVGLAPNVKIIPIKIIDKLQKMELNLVKGIEYAISKNVDIIHISLGTYEKIPMLEEAIKKAYNKGIFIVSSVGNDGIATATYPARYGQVISIGSTDKDGKLAHFSNHGDLVDFYLPGVDIFSTGFGQGYYYSSGTSFSAAIFTGLLANMIQTKGKAYAREFLNDN